MTRVVAAEPGLIKVGVDVSPLRLLGGGERCSGEPLSTGAEEQAEPFGP